MKRHTLYHRALRLSALVVALVLLFDSGLVFQETRIFSEHTKQYLGSVIGISASVEPTGLNVVTAELTEREQELNRREAALKEREINAQAVGNTASGSNLSSYILSAILTVLLVLIVLNYLFDFLRQRRLTERHASSV